MAHFAELDDNYIVKQVVVIDNNELIDENNQESEAKGIAFCQSLFGGGNWIQTSYNKKFRKNYASIGFKYDATLDAFISPKPYNSWILNNDCQWKAPVPPPEHNLTNDPPKRYHWDEETLTWIERYYWDEETLSWMERDNLMP